MQELLQNTPSGLYCPAGDFYIDPWAPVDRAVITHAHADHARYGSRSYLATPRCCRILHERLGPQIQTDPLPFGEPRKIGDVTLSLHPAGHVLGSAQVRIESRGQIAVITGDYKRGQDPTTEPFEPLRCHLLVTESTFGLPIYRWPNPATIRAEINDWWRENRDAGRTSILLGYALGKAQRLLAMLDPNTGPILLHGAVERLTAVYRECGIPLPDTLTASVENAKAFRETALVIAPPSAAGSPWVRKFQPCSLAMASGWMLVRGTRRRRGLDRGFVLSDHVDWPELLQTVEESGAEQVWVTHGYREAVVRYLSEQGRTARSLETQFESEPDEKNDAP